jgi:prepilin-type processing-associated H-X9-DG protein
MIESYGVIAIVLVFVGMMVVLYRFQAAVADRTACGQNLKMLMEAMTLYSEDYDGHYPQQQGWAKDLLPYVENLGIYSCPADKGAYRLHRKKIRSTDIPVSYWYLASSFGQDDESSAPLVGDRMLPTLCGNHDDGGNVGYLDGHVSWWTSEQWGRMHLPTEQYDRKKR